MPLISISSATAQIQVNTYKPPAPYTRCLDEVVWEQPISEWVPAIPAKAGRHIAYISCLKRKINIIQN